MTTAEPTLTGNPVHDATERSRTRRFINHEQMRAHHENGLVTPLSRDITDHVQYNGHWWMADRNGWHLIDDDDLTQLLDTQRKWVEADVYLGGRARTP